MVAFFFLSLLFGGRGTEDETMPREVSRDYI